MFHVHMTRFQIDCILILKLTCNHRIKRDLVIYRKMEQKVNGVNGVNGHASQRWSPFDFLDQNIYFLCGNEVSTLRHTVDGGTDRWLSYLRLHNYTSSEIKQPDLVSGDMDSITERSKTECTSAGSEIITTPDQNETDFTKALRVIRERLNNSSSHIDAIIVIAETAGRLDHIMANVNTLFKAMTFFNETYIYMLSSNSLTWLLPTGKHIIDVPREIITNKSWCALVPIGGICGNLSTKGLKWNLNNSVLAFGELVSTSNTYDGTTPVTVDTSDPLLWTMSTKPFWV